MAEVGDPGDAGELTGGQAAGGVHAERKDRSPAAYILGEPGPEDLGGGQGNEPHHGQAPEHQRAGGEDLVLIAELSQRCGGLSDLPGGEAAEIASVHEALTLVRHASSYGSSSLSVCLQGAKVVVGSLVT